MALLRNMVTAVSEVLERQRAVLMVVAGCQPTSGRQQLAIHATKWPQGGRREQTSWGCEAFSRICGLSPSQCRGANGVIPERDCFRIEQADGYRAPCHVKRRHKAADERARDAQPMLLQQPSCRVVHQI